MRSRHALALALLGGLALAGCAGGSSGARPAAGHDSGPIEMALAGVGSLDPARAVTAQDTELDWALYLPLLTYRHARGQAGTGLIPGVAAGMPAISDGGRLYTLSVRRGLHFSDGRTVRASDVVATFERVIDTRLSPVRPLLLPVLEGAVPFASGEARSLSGVRGDDRSGVVTIRLTRPDPGFEAVLAEPALGIVPAGSPLHDRPGHPPAGVGPYRLREVRPGHSFTLQRNPYWSALPGVPAGQVDIDVTESRDPDANALAVLNDVLDVADPVQSLIASARAQIARQAGGRARLTADGRPVAFLFLGMHAAPFDDRLAREGVLEALGATAPARAATRTLAAACQVVPEVSSSATPDGCPAPELSPGTLAAARSLVRRSGTAGASVVVWSPPGRPERGWLRDEAAVLRAIGYAARVATVPASRYRGEVQALVRRPAAGHSRSNSSSVRPLLARRAVKGAGEPGLVSAVAVLDGRLASDLRVPAADALTVALSPAGTLGRVLADHQTEFAEPAATELMSWRMDESAAVLDPVEGLDLTSLRLR